MKLLMVVQYNKRRNEKNKKLYNKTSKKVNILLTIQKKNPQYYNKIIAEVIAVIPRANRSPEEYFLK